MNAHREGVLLALCLVATAVLPRARAQVETRRGPAELRLVSGEGRPELVPMGESTPSRWVTVAELDRIEISAPQEDLEPLPVASCGGQSWKFAPGDRGVCTLSLHEAIRRAWTDEGELAVVVEVGTGRSAVTLKARPEKLDLAGDPTEFTIEQRQRAWVPGSRRYLRLSLGDITGGRVRVGFEDAEGRKVVPSQAMRQGDELRFSLGEQDYVLGLKRLVNVLIGDDHAVFTVDTRSDETARRINAVVEAVESSDLTFVRNGVEYSGAQAAEFLRRKYAWMDRPAGSFSDFVDDVATRSSTTGKPYLVRDDRGRDRPLAAWLREQDEALEEAREDEGKQPDE